MDSSKCPVHGLDRTNGVCRPFFSLDSSLHFCCYVGKKSYVWRYCSLFECHCLTVLIWNRVQRKEERSVCVLFLTTSKSDWGGKTNEGSSLILEAAVNFLNVLRGDS